MPTGVVYRPNPKATWLAVGALPGIAVVVALMAVQQWLHGALGAAVLLLVLCGVCAAAAWAIASRIFSIRVDGEALRIVGLFGMWRWTLAWPQVEEVGVAPVPDLPADASERLARQRMLVVRLHRPLAAKPRWAWRWRAEGRMLYVAGLERWSGPEEGVAASVRRFAGPRWREGGWG